MMRLAHLARVDDIDRLECAHAAVQHRADNRPKLVGRNDAIPARLIAPNESDGYLAFRCRHDGEIRAVSLKALPQPVERLQASSPSTRSAIPDLTA